MTIRIRRTPEPLSEQSAAPGESGEVLAAQSHASRILEQELRRYCEGQIQGRSFLISGHRGAGKTTMVADALGRLISLSQAGPMATASNATLLRPLPVMLHGPSLFRALPSDLQRAAARQVAVNTDPSPRLAPTDTPAVASQREPPMPPPAAPAVVAASSAPPPPPQASEFEKDAKVELQAQVALTQIILGLHRATLREYAAAYRSKLLADPWMLTDAVLTERAELAAQFELELMEDPPASRLREFWEHAGTLESGILQPQRRLFGQGMRELAALNGICNAHQRISGELSGEIKQKLDNALNVDKATGIDPKFAEAIKPASALLSGAVIAGGAISASAKWPVALALGVGVAVASSLLFKRNVTSNVKRERHVDKTFIPDLSLRTLDRVLPILLERLRNAGLAPVFVIDELDKVDGLSDRIKDMVHYLKKLVAESVFTCFLTDRGYMESLRLAAREKAYGVASSYFSLPLLIAHEPADLAAYLDEVLQVEQPGPGSSSQADLADKEVLKWVLRHRSQMHALNLTRELVAMRTPAGQLNLQLGIVRDAYVYRIDATLQVAIEFILNSPLVVGWSMQRIDMRQTLLDALYFLSRAWLRGDEGVDLREASKDAFRTELFTRMNLSEVYLNGADGKPQLPEDAERRLISDHDLTLLIGIVGEMAALLIRDDLSQHVEHAWPANRHERVGAPLAPQPEEVVRGVLLQGQQSFLIQEPGPEPRESILGGRQVYRFRYWPSGDVRVAGPMKPDASGRYEAAVPAAPSSASENQQKPEASTARRWVELLAQAAQPLALVTQLETSFATLLKGEEADQPSPGHVDMKLMADEALVLPQNPPWQQAVASHQALLDAHSGTGNLVELEGHVMRLSAFAAMLSDSCHALGPAFRMAAFLVGVQKGSQEPLRASMGRALRLLARGLDLGRRKPDDVVHVVNASLASIQPLPSTTMALSTAPQFERDGTLMPEALRWLSSWLVDGEKFAEQQDWAVCSARAWDQLRTRLDAQDRRMTPLNAGSDELLCAMRPDGPALFLPDLASGESLAQWSRLLLAILGFRDGRDKAARPPFELARSTLLRLGLAQAQPQWLARFCSETQVLADEAPEAGRALAQELNEVIGSASASSSAPSSTGTLLMVGAAQSSITDGWTESPLLAMCLVLSVEDAEDSGRPIWRLPMLKHGSAASDRSLGRWIAQLPLPLHVVWEPEKSEPPAWLLKLALDAGNPVVPLKHWLPAQRPAALHGSRGADELISWLRR